jgi:CheY-like chemotaxis protein
MDSIEERLKGRCILIVDDDSRNTFALLSYLDGMEMKIYTAGDGFQAIELWV